MQHPAGQTEAIEFKPRILIIDDSPPMIRLLAPLLQDMAEVLFATAPEAGMRMAASEKPQIILLDQQMPGLDGLEVCRRLKADPATRGSSIIFVTGQSGVETEVAALQAGAVDFISKPVNPAVVRARVQTHLSLHQKSAQLEHMAMHDGLTGTLNRRYFDLRLADELRRHLRQQQALGLAIVDVDHFKAYNDRYGHLQGDDCLRQIASLLAAVARRPGETLARYGGEEFGLVLPLMDAAHAAAFGERLCESVRSAHISHAGSPLDFVTVSVGIVALVPQQADTPASLIQHADAALYRAKAGGRNQCQVAPPR